jgi:hypothetical protein
MEESESMISCLLALSFLAHIFSNRALTVLVYLVL